MICESNEHGKERHPEEDRKQPYEKPTVTKRPITRAEKQTLLEDQDETKNEKSKGKASGSG
jgi:hypothetical protein